VGEGNAVRKDSFWHDPESRERGTTKVNCFFSITEFRVTHCETFDGGDTFGYDRQHLSFFLMNTQHSCGREKEEEEAAHSYAAGMVRSKE